MLSEPRPPLATRRWKRAAAKSTQRAEIVCLPVGSEPAPAAEGGMLPVLDLIQFGDRPARACGVAACCRVGERFPSCNSACNHVL